MFCYYVFRELVLLIKFHVLSVYVITFICCMCVVFVGIYIFFDVWVCTDVDYEMKFICCHIGDSDCGKLIFSDRCRLPEGLINVAWIVSIMF